MRYKCGFIFFTIVLSFLAGCSEDDYEANLEQLGDKSFLLEVNRISEYPEVQFPSDQLYEKDYVETSKGSEYEVRFSEDMRTVTIMLDSISGTLMADTEEYKRYDLDNGLFAGGRFIVWVNESQFEAEYTIYGSGVPIIRSERGNLF